MAVVATAVAHLARLGERLGQTCPDLLPRHLDEAKRRDLGDLMARTVPAQALDEDDYPEGLTDKRACLSQNISLGKRYISPCGICIKVCPVGEDRKHFGRENPSIYTNKEKFPEYHRAWDHVRSYGGK